MMVMIRIRSLVWFVTGAVLALVVSLLVMDTWRADAAPGDADSTFVPITSCRLIDTRPAPDRVGPLSTWGEANTKTVQATGPNGNCTIPAGVDGLSMNVTSLNATADGFLTFWPSGVLPLAASLNPSPGQPPIPNAVTVQLSSTGSFNVYNENGSVDIVIDVNGYYTNTTLKEIDSRLTSLDKSQSFTVANTGESFAIVGPGGTSVAAVTLTAPVAGQVTVAAYGSILDPLLNVRFTRCAPTDAIESITYSDYNVEVGSVSDQGTPTFSLGRVFDVAAGENNTYYLLCQTAPLPFSEFDQVAILSPHMSATFTPAP